MRPLGRCRKADLFGSSLGRDKVSWVIANGFEAPAIDVNACRVAYFDGRKYAITGRRDGAHQVKVGAQVPTTSMWPRANGWSTGSPSGQPKDRVLSNARRTWLSSTSGMSFFDGSTPHGSLRPSLAGDRAFVARTDSGHSSSLLGLRSGPRRARPRPPSKIRLPERCRPDRQAPSPPQRAPPP